MDSDFTVQLPSLSKPQIKALESPVTATFKIELVELYKLNSAQEPEIAGKVFAIFVLFGS